MKNTPYQVHQVDASCWRIEENGVRSFVVKGAEKTLLIDTGFGTGNLKEMVDNLSTLPVMLVNTHTDKDHIGCNALFEKAYMHPSEYDRYHHGLGAGQAVEPLWEGDRIDLGKRSLEVLFLPGHTPGSIALLDAENRVLFSGDSVQAGTIYMFGQGRNMQAYIESMTRLAAISDRFDTAYPSHGLIPIQSDIIEGLIAGAKRVLKGDIKGTQADRPGISAKLYDVGVAKFLYDR